MEIFLFLCPWGEFLPQVDVDESATLAEIIVCMYTLVPVRCSINFKAVYANCPTVVDGMVDFRSVLVLNGNGADVAKHAVPAVPTER